MKKDKISEIISNIDDRHIVEATMYAVGKVHDQRAMPEISEEKKTLRIRWNIVAACLAFFIIIGIGTTAIALAVEAKEYNAAVAFFESNGLSTDGLSRSDLKAVYRDITTQRFTHGKTAEVMRQAIPGFEITQDEPTPEELAALWDRNVGMNSLPQSGIYYKVDNRYKLHEQLGFEVIEKNILECFQDGKLLWTAEFTEGWLEDSSYMGEDTAVWGQNEIWSSTEPTYGWLARVDDEGTVKWTRRLNHGFSDEYIAAVLSNGDGMWAVISRGDEKFLCLSSYDKDGNELSFKKTEVGNLDIWNAACLGDGYIVQLGNQQSRDTALLFKLDREGNVLKSFTYEGDDCEYYLSDMAEFGGQVYLSAYAVPKQNDEGGRHEIADVLDFVVSKEKGGWDITSEELTPVVRENYTAVLLLCDQLDGTTKTFYSVKGSLGGKLSVNDAGQLAWDVESITSTFSSPATSSFTIGGTCKVFRYNFDPAGILTQQVDTGETVPYRR